MKSYFFSIPLPTKLNLHKDSGFLLRLSFFFLLLLNFQFTYAQNDFQDVKNSPSTIFITDGAEIISGDKSFNQQILDRRVIVKNSVKSFLTLQQKKYVVLRSKNTKYDLAAHVKNLQLKKQRDLIKKVERVIHNHELTKKKFLTRRFNKFPVASYFTAQQLYNKNFISPSSSKTDGKFIKENNFSLFAKPFFFRQSRFFTFFNNEYINLCFIGALTLRPPPFRV